MGKHILIATEANEGWGHILPWKASIELLLQRGNPVTFACPTPRLAYALFQLPALRCEPILWPSMHAGAASGAADNWAQLLANLGYASPKAVHACLQRWVALFRSVAPGSVVADYAPLAMVAAHALNIPFIEAGSGFCVPPNHGDAALLLPHALNKRLSASAQAAIRHHQQAVMAAVNLALSSLSLSPSLQSLNQLYQLAGHRCVTSQPQLDPYLTDRVSRTDVLHLGPLALTPSGEIPHAWCDASPERLRVLCYLKPWTPQLPDFVAALQTAQGCEVLVAGLLPADIQASLNPLARHIHLTPAGADFSRALLIADVFITNGGVHSLSWALELGSHCVVVPSQAEQAATALHLKNHPRVTVCMTGQALSHRLASSTAASRARPIGTNQLGAEYALIALLDAMKSNNVSKPARTTDCY